MKIGQYEFFTDNELVLKEYIPLLKDFIKEYDFIIKRSYKRDYCDQAADGFVDYINSLNDDNLKAEMIEGNILIDEPQYDYLDFTFKELHKMKNEGYNPKSKTDRIKFAKDNKLDDELKLVPHYYNKLNNILIDFSGLQQFKKTGLVKEFGIKNYK
jgi:hypothetical protein